MPIRDNYFAPGSSGRSLFPSEVWTHLCTALQLSQREMQIVQCVFDDQKEETIAFELGISPHTVNTYFQRLYSKLHVSSRTQLILRIMAEYLKSPPVVRIDSVPCTQATDEYLA